jgi:phosphoribosylamine-glycine ligase
MVKEFRSSGDEVVIEEFLEREEPSILNFCDQYSIRSLPPAQDHKRVFDGDRGLVGLNRGHYFVAIGNGSLVR